MNSDIKTIGKAIRNVRTELGMSMNQFADDIGVCAGMISRYGRNEKAPNWTTILKIVDSCGVDWLVELLEDMR